MSKQTAFAYSALFVTALTAFFHSPIANAQSPDQDLPESPTASPKPTTAPTAQAPSQRSPTSTARYDPAAAKKSAPLPPTSAAPSKTPSNSAIPISLQLRSLEQRVRALKERAWRAKARVAQLKEAVLGGGISARASIVHLNKMGSKYRLLKLIYALDGASILSRSDDSGKLHRNKQFNVLSGPLAPGSHTLSVLATYRGNGYGIFRYLNKYRFTVRSSHTFTVEEGKATNIRVLAFESGNATTPMDKRPAIDFEVGSAGGHSTR